MRNLRRILVSSVSWPAMTSAGQSPTMKIALATLEFEQRHGLIDLIAQAAMLPRKKVEAANEA